MKVMIFRYKQTHRQTLIIIYITSSWSMCVTRTGRCRALVSGSSLVLRRWRQSWWASCSRRSPGDSQLWGWHTSHAEHDQREHDDDHGDVRQQTTVDTSVAEEEGRNISLRCRVSGVASSSASSTSSSALAAEPHHRRRHPHFQHYHHHLQHLGEADFFVMVGQGTRKISLGGS